MRAANHAASGCFHVASMRALISEFGLTYARLSARALWANTRTNSPALNLGRGVCCVSTSLLKPQRCPACSRRSSLRFKRRTGSCAAIPDSDMGSTSVILRRILTDWDPQDAAQSPQVGNEPVFTAALGQSRRLVSVG